MKKIIILISLCSVMTSYAADNESVSASYGLFSDQTSSVGSTYSISAGIDGGLDSTDYSLFSNSDASFDNQGAWVGVAGKYGGLKLGTHDALDSLAISGADQQRQNGAYDLLIQDDAKLTQSLTYFGGSKKLSIGAQVATEDNESKTSSAGLLLNAQSRSVEAAIGYRRTTDEAKAVKGRLTYKSRNNSRVRLDLVAEKFDAGDEADDSSVDSTSLMLGAKYKLTPKTYVVGQYGVVGFGDDVDLSADNLSDNKDYNALSLEAGYSLSDKTSVYINHTQKSFDSGLQLPFEDDLKGGSQTNSIGVRLNW